MMKCRDLNGIGNDKGRHPLLNRHNLSDRNDQVGYPSENVGVEADMRFAKVHSSVCQDLAVEGAGKV